MLIFSGAVLQKEHRVPLHPFSYSGGVAMGHVLHGIEVLVVGRDFDPAAPTARAVEHQRSRIRYRDVIDPQLVVVETFVLCVGDARPQAVVALGHGIPDTADIKLQGLGVRRPESRAHAPLRVDLGILFDLPVDYRV
jgi:hypothetical protein